MITEIFIILWKFFLEKRCKRVKEILIPMSACNRKFWRIKYWKIFRWIKIRWHKKCNFYRKNEKILSLTLEVNMMFYKITKNIHYEKSRYLLAISKSTTSTFFISSIIELIKKIKNIAFILEVNSEVVFKIKNTLWKY